MIKAIDIHTHPPSKEYLIDGHGPYLVKLPQHFGHQELKPVPIEQMVDDYREMGLMATISSWDAETTTGLPKTPNDQVAEIAQRFPDVFIGWAHVDPWKGKEAVKELERAVKDLGLRGVGEFHPIMQEFYPNDQRFYPLWEKCVELGIPASFHTGTTGTGAGTPGGSGFRIKYSHPLHLDDLAVDFPELTIIGCHPSFPWQDDMLAVAVHKENVYIDLSGWSPKYFSENLLRHLNGRLANKAMFGTDYPWIHPRKWLGDFENIDLKPEVKQKILLENAQRILGIEVPDGK